MIKLPIVLSTKILYNFVHKLCISNAFLIHNGKLTTFIFYFDVKKSRQEHCEYSTHNKNQQ